jgi:TRAP-type mannitol/chloroaromatic compound transport system permease large subunit
MVAGTIIGFFLMIGMMLLGIPIAVSMFIVGVGGGLLAFGQPFIESIASVAWGVQNENLLTSIPLFIMLGELLLSGRLDELNRDFHPKSAKEELKEELDDLAQRQTTEGGTAT